MKTLISIALILSVTILGTSCSSPDKAWRDRLVNVDSIAINFFPGDGTMDPVVRVKVIRDAATIDSVRQWVTAEQASKPAKPCGPQASFHFFAMGKVMHDAEVGIANCGLIQYRWQGETHFNQIPAALASWIDRQRNNK